MLGKLGPVRSTPFHVWTEELSVVRHRQNPGISQSPGRGGHRLRSHQPGSPKGTVPPMCGIVGYVGEKVALDVVVEGLRRLEYRGYDSAGVAVVADGTLHVAKKAGKLGNLEKLLGEEQLPPSSLGIGHTRWATHGGPQRRQRPSAYLFRRPHRLVHNGIIENYVTLRDELAAGRHHLRVRDRSGEIVAAARPAGLGGTPLAEAMRGSCGRLGASPW